MPFPRKFLVGLTTASVLLTSWPPFSSAAVAGRPLVAENFQTQALMLAQATFYRSGASAARRVAAQAGLLFRRAAELDREHPLWAPAFLVVIGVPAAVVMRSSDLYLSLQIPGAIVQLAVFYPLVSSWRRENLLWKNGDYAGRRIALVSPMPKSDDLITRVDRYLRPQILHSQDWLFLVQQTVESEVAEGYSHLQQLARDRQIPLYDPIVDPKGIFTVRELLREHPGLGPELFGYLAMRVYRDKRHVGKTAAMEQVIVEMAVRYKVPIHAIEEGVRLMEHWKTSRPNDFNREWNRMATWTSQKSIALSHQTLDAILEKYPARPNILLVVSKTYGPLLTMHVPEKDHVSKVRLLEVIEAQTPGEVVRIEPALWSGAIRPPEPTIEQNAPLEMAVVGLWDYLAHVDSELERVYAERGSSELYRFPFDMAADQAAQAPAAPLLAWIVNFEWHRVSEYFETHSRLWVEAMSKAELAAWKGYAEAEEDLQAFKIYLSLSALARRWSEGQFREPHPLYDHFAEVYNRYVNKGEAFRKKADRSQGTQINDRPLRYYLFFRELFNGREFGVLRNSTLIREPTDRLTRLSA